MRLSVLDQSPVAEGSSPAAALLTSVELARAVDDIGVVRYWLAEHHGSAGFAGTAPEILATAVLAATCRLRVGSGGVLLPRHDAVKVAENFRVLSALFPGRVDLGLGRAGGPPGRYPQQLAELYVALGLGRDSGGPDGGGPDGGDPDGGDPDGCGSDGAAAAGVMPTGTASPQIWLLGGGGDSAALAGRLGASYCHAHFLNARSGVAALEAYRAHLVPRPELSAPRGTLAVRVVTADTAAEAGDLAAGLLLWRSRKDLGEDLPFPSPETVARHRWTGAERGRAAVHGPALIFGTPEQVQVDLAGLAAEHDVDELVVNTPTHDPVTRLRSFQLLVEVLARVPERSAAG